MILPPLKLNPALDPADYAQTYRQEKFVQIPDLLETEAAAAVTDVLQQVPWRLCYHEPGRGTVQLTQDDVRALGQQGLAERMQKVMALAAKNHGYCYNTFHLTRADGLDGEHPIRALTEFLQGDEFLAFGGAVIDHAGLTQVDAQATLYTPGSFLTRHTDEGLHRERRAAFTLGFSQNWQTDWGGLLMFIDRQTTDVTSAWLPRFNTLTLFDGLRVHAVSPVSSFAPAGRYSIAGWYRDDPR